MNLGILKLHKLKFILLAILLSASHFLGAGELDFSLIKKGDDGKKTLLVIGGIQGDEPGGFLSASILSTHYKIKKGSLWVVPNLNFPSIVKKSRGISGDMNRKFAHVDKNDPDYENVQKIKKILTNEKVKMVVHLHDGSGFYREKHTDWTFSPNRWGQCSIIDQKKIDGVEFGNLEENAKKVANHINNKLLSPVHKYNVRNTDTKTQDKEMQKALTFFALNQGKAAYANEASKELNAHERVYYHLLALEKYMEIFGIEFERDFELKPHLVKKAIEENVHITFYDRKIYLDLTSVRPTINYFPIKKGAKLEFKASNPLTTVIKEDYGYGVYYGNKLMTKLIPQYVEYDEAAKKVEVIADGNKKEIAFGETLDVKEYFNIIPNKNFRANVIGFTGQDKNEMGFDINKKYFSKNYSIDKNGKTYRVEIYGKNNAFVGMFLVNFNSREQIAMSSVATNSNSNKIFEN